MTWRQRGPRPHSGTAEPARHRARRRPARHGHRRRRHAGAGGDSFAAALAGADRRGRRPRYCPRRAASPATTWWPRPRSTWASRTSSAAPTRARAWTARPWSSGSTRISGIKLPRLAYEQAKAGQPVASLAEAKPGDILAFDSPVDHVGIYLGNNKMIAAPQAGRPRQDRDRCTRSRPHIRRIVSDVADRRRPGGGHAPAGRLQGSGVARRRARTATCSSRPAPSTASRPSCSPRSPRSSPVTTRTRSAGSALRV